MKKTLLTFLTMALSFSAFSQATPSPFWSTIQNTNFTVSAAGIRWVDAVNANDVWAVGYDGFAPNRNYNWFTRSTTGGALFTSGQIFADTNTYVLANLDAIDANTAWVSSYMKASGNMGAAHQTTNGGISWTNMKPAGSYTNAASFVNLVCFVTPSIGIIQGDPVAGEFEIWRTTDGGASWTKVPGANIPNPAAASEYGTVNIYTKYGSNDIWFGTNFNRVFHSSDGGLNWTTSAALTSTIGAAVGIDDLAFTDPNNGIVTAYFGSPATLTMWQTNDGGATFTLVPNIDPNYGRNDICAIAGTSWYASVGAASTNTVISYSFDQGVTWNSWGGSGIQYLYIDFIDNTTGWAGSFSSQVVVGTEGMFKYSGTPLGVQNNASIPLAVNLYPNPSNGIITIKMPPAKEGAVISVFDVLGKQVYSQNIKTASIENVNLNLQHLGKGIYSINIAKGNEMFTQKVVIE